MATRRVESRVCRTAGVAPVLVAMGLLALVAGCGGSGGSTGSSSSLAVETPAVTVLPASANIVSTEALSVVVTVSASGAGYPTPTGTVTLSSGVFLSTAFSLASGSALFTVPASSLAAGSDTLKASYTPSSTATADFNPATGTAAVSVSTGATPVSVAATSVTYPTSGAPFEALAAPNGIVYVGVPSGIQVFTPPAGLTVGTLTAACVDPFSSTLQSESASTSELSLLPNGVDLAAGINLPGAGFYNLAALQTCSATPNVVSQGSIASDQGTQAIAVTPDGKYAFVSNEYGVASGAVSEGNIGVVALQYDSSGNVLPTSMLLGQISTGGNAIAGMILSPDATRLYVTSEVALSAAQATASGTSNPILGRTGCTQGGGGSQINGLLTVINVARAEASPTSSAILATVAAGCSPVRMAETADNSTLWVAIRGDDRVLAFSTAFLEADPANALLGYAATGGTAPVGIALFHSDQLLAVANSNRFNTGTANATILSVSDPTAAAVLTTIPTGLFPREITLAPDASTLYLTNYSSGTLQVISTTVH